MVELVDEGSGSGSWEVGLVDEEVDDCSSAGFKITRGYAGFWVFEALLNEVWVWVFVGMGIREKKCFHAYARKKQKFQDFMHMRAFFSQTA